MSKTSCQSFLNSDDLKQALAEFEMHMGHSLRSAALDSFMAQDVSLVGKEDWKYSNLKGVFEGSFTPYKASQRTANEIRSFVPETSGISLVFVNGTFRSDLSVLSELPDGVTLQTMSSAADSNHFANLANIDNSPFTALNTALWQDGVFLELAPGSSLEKPVNIINLSDGDANASFIALRNLIIAGSGSKASITEYYADCNQENGSILNIPVTEIICGPDSDINHLKIVQENANMYHLGSTHVKQETSSRFASQEFALNGNSVRRELHLQLAGEGASCDLKALYLGRNNHQVDMRTRVNHLVAGCTTNELYKGILADNSHGIFDGLIKVARDAQQTSAHQTNRTLVLSDDAVSYSIPRLEIYADDVKCSHGSTTGQLEDEQIFFLRSRGFTEEKARTMLATAFAREIVMSVTDPVWQKVLDTEIDSRLAKSSDRSTNNG